MKTRGRGKAPRGRGATMGRVESEKRGEGGREEETGEGSSQEDSGATPGAERNGERVGNM